MFLILGDLETSGETEGGLLLFNNGTDLLLELFKRTEFKNIKNTRGGPLGQVAKTDPWIPGMEDDVLQRQEQQPRPK